MRAATAGRIDDGTVTTLGRLGTTIDQGLNLPRRKVSSGFVFVWPMNDESRTKFGSTGRAKAETGFACTHDRLAPTVDPELTEDDRHVIAGGALADPEPRAYRVVVEALCHQLEDFALARR